MFIFLNSLICIGSYSSGRCLLEGSSQDVCMANSSFSFCSDLTLSNEFCWIALSNTAACLLLLTPPYPELFLISSFSVALSTNTLCHLSPVIFMVYCLSLPSHVSSTRESLSALALPKCLDQGLTSSRPSTLAEWEMISVTHMYVHASVWLCGQYKLCGTGLPERACFLFYVLYKIFYDFVYLVFTS